MLKDENKNSMPELSQEKNFLGKWAEFFINRYRVTFLIIAVILVWGIAKGMDLQREAQPKVTIPFAGVSTTYLGASPEEVESLITDPLEEKFEELDDVKRITSSSGFGYSSIFLEFEPGVDVDEKVREVRDKASDAKSLLPDDAEDTTVLGFKTGESPVLVLALSGEKEILELQQYAKKIKEEIELIEGVRDVAVLGDVEREISVVVDPQKLAAGGISIYDIQNALSQSNVNFPGGDVELNGKEYNIRTVGKFKSTNDIENTVVKQIEGRQVYLKDVAEIKDTYKEAEIYASKMVMDEKGGHFMQKAIAVSIRKKVTADSIHVRDRIIKTLEEKKELLYPDDVELEVFSDMAKYVGEQLGSVTNNAISGLCLVIVVLFLFIGFRESMVVSFVIPLSLCFGLGMMNAFGMTLNMMTMFSIVLAVGMLVDNAIVMMENVDRLRSYGISPELAAKAGSNQIAPAIMASTLTTLAAFFPMILTSGIMGDFIRPIPMTVIFMICASFLMALTVTPSLSSKLLKRNGLDRKIEGRPAVNFSLKIFSVLIVFVLISVAFQDWEQDGFARFGPLSLILGLVFAAAMFVKQFLGRKKREGHFVIEKYSNALRWIISNTWKKVTVIILLFILFLASLSLIPMGVLKMEMFGAEDFETLYLEVETPPGSTLEYTLNVQKQMEQKLYGIEEIKTFMSYAGHDGIDIWSGFELESKGVANKGRILIQLFDAELRDRTSMEIAQQLRRDLKDIPGANIKVIELEEGPPSDAPIFLRIKGEDMGELEKTANHFDGVLETIEGVRNIKTSISDVAPEIQVKIDKEKAAALGLNDMVVASSIRGAVHGITATRYRSNQDEIDVVIKTSEEELKTIYDLEKIKFYNNRGVGIPFSQVAEITETESVMSINHDEGKRSVYVTADVNPETTTAVEALKEFQEKIENYRFPEGLALEYGGENEAMGDSFGDMLVNMIIAAILVFIILAVQFNSLSQPVIILITVPMALIGVMPGLAITGNNFGFLAFVGLVALVGIAVNDAIVLVDYINYLRKAGYEMREAIVKTGATRFIPVLATTITTAGGILPITLKEKFFEPLGVALIFGLCMATVLTLVIVPTVYSIFEEHKLKVRERKRKKAEIFNKLELQM